MNSIDRQRRAIQVRQDESPHRDDLAHLRRAVTLRYAAGGWWQQVLCDLIGNRIPEPQLEQLLDAVAIRAARNGGRR